MKLALIGTYPPTRCGIATFTNDVANSLKSTGAKVEVIRVIPVDEADLPSKECLKYQTDLTLTDRPSYADTARRINRSDIDVVLIEHEFGIYGPDAGTNLLDLTSALEIPYVVTFHTVLPAFSKEQSLVVKKLCNGASAVTVFTSTARALMLKQGLVAPSKVRIVSHGAPIEMYSPRPDGAEIRHRLGLAQVGRVAATFGLLSEGKGIEVAISAIAALPASLSDVIYVVAGQTHPSAFKRVGERYRNQLVDLAQQLGISDRIVFIDRFMDVDEIADLLSITEVFVTPYRGVDQIVSGALTFALAAGCPVVSTPYRYACDMLADGAGTLVPFDDVEALATGIVELLDGPSRQAALIAAQKTADGLSWPAIGTKLAAVLSEIAGRRDNIPIPLAERFGQLRPRGPAIRRIHQLCDDTAVLQHADHLIPRAEEGYCVDDAARVLPIFCDLAKSGSPSAEWEIPLVRMLTFLRAAALDASPGTMRNFMSWDRRWLDEPHSGDHVGRAVWGLGDVAGRDSRYASEATKMLDPLVTGIDGTSSIRTVAYAVLGLVAAGERAPEVHLRRLHDVVSKWKLPDDRNWRWYEPRLTYDNARLAQAQIAMGHSIGDSQLVRTGLEALDWLDDLCWQGDHFRFPGHLGLTAGDDINASGDEQPLEAAGMAEAFYVAAEATGHPSWNESVERAWNWFVGANRLGIAIGDVESGSCFDALTATGANQNCGAESAIAFNRCWATYIEAEHKSAHDRYRHHVRP